MASGYKRSTKNAWDSTAEKWYGRRLTIEEAAYHQGFVIPQGWYELPPFDNPEKGKPFTSYQWNAVLYEAIGNGVPTYMAQGFGEAYSKPAVEGGSAIHQYELFPNANEVYKRGIYSYNSANVNEGRINDSGR